MRWKYGAMNYIYFCGFRKGPTKLADPLASLVDNCIYEMIGILIFQCSTWM